MAYNIDTEIAVGDPAHIAHHTAMGSAINDLDTRVSNTLPKIVDVAIDPTTDDPNQMEYRIRGVMKAWWNEWRALRGRNPYTTWADALVRAVVENGDNTSGNAIEIEDRRTGKVAKVLWGVNWGTGRVTQCDTAVGMVYTLAAGQTVSDVPSKLPAGTLVVRLTA